jgi:hypothetical protein
MAHTAREVMADQRALLTQREREILSGEADVKDNYRYSVESRVRTRLRDELAVDMGVLDENHGEIAALVRDVVCEDSEQIEKREEPATAEPAQRREETSEQPDGPHVTFPSGVDRGYATAAVFAARDLIRERGGATKKEIVREVMPEHPLGYDVDAAFAKFEAGERYRGSWWRKVMKPGLEALGDVEKPAQGRSEWRYVGEE